MKQTQQMKPPIPHGSHVDCCASLMKLIALQAPLVILPVCVYVHQTWVILVTTTILTPTSILSVRVCLPYSLLLLLQQLFVFVVCDFFFLLMG
jgi:hypothetical protein